MARGTNDQDCQGQPAACLLTTSHLFKAMQFTIQDMQSKVAVLVPDHAEKLILALMDRVLPVLAPRVSSSPFSNELAILARLIATLSGELLAHSDGLRDAVRLFASFFSLHTSRR